MIRRVAIFLILNFGALAIGGLFTGNGVSSEWYADMSKAPWTPPGWAFGAAWTTIMICFSVYMAYLYPKVSKLRSLLLLYAIQWVLNVSWNPTFFYFHQVGIALLIISALTIVVGVMMSRYKARAGLVTLFLLPYFLWLLIATSLNAYPIMVGGG